jgi:hypothetical protein
LFCLVLSNNFCNAWKTTTGPFVKDSSGNSELSDG